MIDKLTIQVNSYKEEIRVAFLYKYKLVWTRWFFIANPTDIINALEATKKTYAFFTEDYIKLNIKL